MTTGTDRGTLHITAIPSSPFRREILVTSPKGERVLYWDVADEVCPIGTGNLLDDALVALTPLAQFHGWSMYVDGDVTREQMANMREYQEAWAVLRPDIFSIVDVSYRDALDVGDVHHPGSAVLAFSGGVDSTYAAMTSDLDQRGTRALNITHGVLVHGFDIALGDDAAIDIARRSAEQVLRELHIEPVVVSTNWRTHFSPNYTMSFGLGLAAVLHQFRPIADAGLITTDATYATEVGTWGRDSTINHLAGHRGFPFPTIGATTARVDKIAAIAHLDVVRANLRVCWQPTANGGNCRRCGKCVRTTLGLAAAGYPDSEALGKVSLKALASVDLSMWDRIYLSGMLEHPRMLDEDLQAAIAHRMAETDTHDSQERIHGT